MSAQLAGKTFHPSSCNFRPLPALLHGPLHQTQYPELSVVPGCLLAVQQKHLDQSQDQLVISKQQRKTHRQIFRKPYSVQKTGSHKRMSAHCYEIWLQGHPAQLDQYLHHRTQ